MTDQNCDRSVTDLSIGAVERELRINARPETIFEFLVDPTQMIRWMGVRATLDPRPGGIYHVDITDRHSASGTYLEVVPHTRVVFSWGWEGEESELPPGASTVEITLHPDGSETILRFRHYGLSPDQQKGHGEGWDHFLPRLETVAEGRDPGPDPWAA